MSSSNDMLPTVAGLWRRLANHHPGALVRRLVCDKPKPKRAIKSW